MEQTTTRGGKRTNAGRKPSNNPKKAITLYVEKSIIERYGNNGLRELIYKTIKTQNNDFITHNQLQEQQP
jgi:hypothetical protein